MMENESESDERDDETEFAINNISVSLAGKT